jgi:hypothetical protein
MKIYRSLILVPLILLSGCFVCPGKGEALDRAKSASQERLSLLFDQLKELHSKRHSNASEFANIEGYESIPQELEDLAPRMISLYSDSAYFSFWFCMDEGIQYQVYGFEEGKIPQITLSWGEPNSGDYHEEVIWLGTR